MAEKKKVLADHISAVSGGKSWQERYQAYCTACESTQDFKAKKMRPLPIELWVDEDEPKTPCGREYRWWITN